MTKHRFLIAAAATALAVGSGVAFAQNPGAGPGEMHKPSANHSTTTGSGSMGSSGSMKSHRTTTGAGAMGESKGPGAHKRLGSEQHGAQEKSPAGKQRMGESGKPGGKSETTGQAPNESHPGNSSKSGQLNEGKGNRLNKNARENERLNKSGAANHTGARSTTGQGAPNGAMQNHGGTMERQGGTMQREGGMNRRGMGATTGSANESEHLSSDQRTRIRQVIVSEHNAPRVGHVDFALNVGTTIPRHRVRLVTVPRRIVEIEPRWRGYEYFMVGDQIVIVNPRTLRIVAVLPA